MTSIAGLRDKKNWINTKDLKGINKSIIKYLWMRRKELRMTPTFWLRQLGSW